MPSQFTAPKYRTQKKRLLFSFLSLLFFVLLLISMSGCNQDTAQAELWPMDKTCDLHTQACTASNGTASVTLKISPSPIPIARPLGIEVELSGLKPTEVQLDISGVNMYMGYNRVPLSSKKPGNWVGTSMLAFCTAEKMEWQITLMMTVDGKQIQVPFYLETSNRGQ